MQLMHIKIMNALITFIMIAEFVERKFTKIVNLW